MRYSIAFLGLPTLALWPRKELFAKLAPCSALFVYQIACFALIQVSESSAQTRVIQEGTFVTEWLDPPSGSTSQEASRHYIYDDAGGRQQVLLSQNVIRSAGGLTALNLRRVWIEGASLVTEGRGRESTITAQRIVPLSVTAPTVLDELRTTGAGERVNKPYLTVLCQFSDWTHSHFRSREYYAKLTEQTGFQSYHDFWKENSEGRLTFEGSQTIGWYTLPEPRANYFEKKADGAPDFWRPDLRKMLDDCTSVADPHVNFREFHGVNLAFNQFHGPSHGTWFPITLDERFFWLPVTFLSSSVDPATIAHEIGHTLGLPHSLDELGNATKWDVMSGAWLHPVANDWVSPHTIAYHKDRLNWFSPGQRYEALPGSVQEIEIVRHGPPPAAGIRYAITGTADDSVWYTVEARQKGGNYEMLIPGNAVLIHRLNLRGHNGAIARLIDVDGNGDPTDDGATWTPGETFTDSIHGIGVSVLAETPTGYEVRIRRGWQLKVEVPGPGEVVSGDGSFRCTSASCEQIYATRGASVTLGATPAPGALFLNWSGACSGVGLCSVSITQDRRVTANFAFPVSITSDSLRAPATMGAEYRDSLVATGGVGTATWSVAEGKLPRGLTLDGSTGRIHGVVEEAGQFRFTAEAAAGTLQARKQLVIVSGKPVIEAAKLLDQLLGSGSLSASELRFLDLIGNRNGRLDVGDVRAWLLDNQHLTSSQMQTLRGLVEW